MDSLKILVVGNNCKWASWPQKIKELQDWFGQKFGVVDIDLVHTGYTDIPFTKYIETPGAPYTLKGIEPSWYDLHVTPIAIGSGYHIVLFVVNENQWNWNIGNNIARGWRTDNDQGVIQLHIMGQENTPAVTTAGEKITTFYLWARHEITHAIYMLADQLDNTHTNGDTDAGAKKCLDEIVFKQPNTVDTISLLKRIINGLLLAVGLIQSNTFPKYEQDINFPINTPPAQPQPPKRDLLHEFCLAIQSHEGYFPAGTPGFPTGSRSWRNKNPGNLRYVGQKRAIGKDTGNYCIFATYKDGFDALKEQVIIVCDGTSNTYSKEARKRGLKDSSELSLLQFFEVYAPKSDHNVPERYAGIVARKLGVGLDFVIKNLI